MTELTAERIRELLTELGRRLDEEGRSATIYLVGRAAMALQYETTRITADVGAIFSARDEVMLIARQMAAEYELPTGWLNDSAKAWVPGGDTPIVVLDTPGLEVAVASPIHLLAMKMVA